MIPLILLDIDGTIIGSQGHVEDCVWKAVKKVQDAGIKLAVCTGRPCFGVAQKVALRLGPTNPHIFQNGAHISYASGESVKVFAFKEEGLRSLVEKARSVGQTLELYTPSNVYVERRTAIGEAHAKMIGVNPIVRDLLEVATNEPIIRAQWVVPETVLETVTSDLPDDLDFAVATSPAQEGVMFVSITRKGVSKGSAAQLLADSLKVSLEEVMAVGDSVGDIPMLEVVGFPVVMANSPESLRATYQNVAGHVDRCGVVSALESAIGHKS